MKETRRWFSPLNSVIATFISQDFLMPLKKRESFFFSFVAAFYFLPYSSCPLFKFEALMHHHPDFLCRSLSLALPSAEFTLKKLLSLFQKRQVESEKNVSRTREENILSPKRIFVSLSRPRTDCILKPSKRGPKLFSLWGGQKRSSLCVCVFGVGRLD